MNQVFREGCKVFVGFWCLGPKIGFSKGGWWPSPFSIFCSGGCWWMLLLDYKRGVAKKAYKTKILATPFLRERKGCKEERGQRSKKAPPFLHCFLGALKNAESSSTFLGPKFQF